MKTKNKITSKQIKDQSELDRLISKGISINCYIKLKYGLRSSKDISITENNDYFIFNSIDGSIEIIPKNELKNTFLGEALSDGALYRY